MSKTLYDYDAEEKNDGSKSNSVKELKQETKYYSAKIMVVDDSEFHISQCVQSLKKLGYNNIDSLDNPIDLIANLRELSPDLILMDTEMGTRMKGFEVANQLRTAKYEKEFAIIGMSIDSSYREDWIKSGADNFIAKKDFSIGMIFENVIREGLKKYLD